MECKWERMGIDLRLKKENSLNFPKRCMHSWVCESSAPSWLSPIIFHLNRCTCCCFLGCSPTEKKIVGRPLLLWRTERSQWRRLDDCSWHGQGRARGRNSSATTTTTTTTKKNQQCNHHHHFLLLFLSVAPFIFTRDLIQWLQNQYNATGRIIKFRLPVTWQFNNNTNLNFTVPPPPKKKNRKKNFSKKERVRDEMKSWRLIVV